MREESGNFDVARRHAVGADIRLQVPRRLKRMCRRNCRAEARGFSGCCYSREALKGPVSRCSFGLLGVFSQASAAEPPRVCSLKHQWLSHPPPPTTVHRFGLPGRLQLNGKGQLMEIETPFCHIPAGSASILAF